MSHRPIARLCQRFSSISLLSRFFLGSILLSFHLPAGYAQENDPYAEALKRLVEERVASAGVSNPGVLDSIRTTPRHEFVPEGQRSRAYFDMSLPIGSGQTISSPFIVALMTQELDPQPTDKVLEIGTGSGYQAAVLSPLVQHVYTIEIVEELGRTAAAALERLAYDNVSTRIGDGYLGWPEAAPFDKIIVTCSPESIPQPLIDQLREGGMMIIPVGELYQQTLYRLVKQDGELVRQPLRPTLFVPMTGEAEAGRRKRPDPKRPQVVNGGFEQRPQPDEMAIEDYVPGWYYGRMVDILSEPRLFGVPPKTEPENDGRQPRDAASQSFARFQNETPGLSAHLLQGIFIDGREVSRLRLSGRVRVRRVEKGPDPEAIPMVVLTLYDEMRRELSTFWLGPFEGTQPWQNASYLLPVPTATREGILRIGLFGATGTADFDEIQIESIE